MCQFVVNLSMIVKMLTPKIHVHIINNRDCAPVLIAMMSFHERVKSVKVLTTLLVLITN